MGSIGMELLRIHFNRPPDSQEALQAAEIRHISFTVSCKSKDLPENDNISQISGNFPLPSSTMIREIRDMLNAAHSDHYSGVNLARPSCKAACEIFGLLNHNGCMKNFNTWPLQIGQWLYRRILAVNSDMRIMTDGLLGKLQGIGGEPQLCILIDFVDLTSAFHGLIADLASLPWEALTIAHNNNDNDDDKDNEPIEPLEQTHAIVIARQIYNNHKQTTSLPKFSLHRPVRVLAVTPTYDPTGHMHLHEQRARPYNPATHSTPFVWCDCPPVVHGVSVEALSDQLEKYKPPILHFFGHGNYLVKRSDKDRSVFTLQLDRKALDHVDDISPLALRFALRSDLSFIALFACLSGAFDQLQNQDLRENSIIAALTERIPAVLAMATRIPQCSAGLAGETLYAKLAQGAELLDAVHAVRSALWGDAKRKCDRRTEQKAWYVPVLYLQGMSSSYRFSDTPELRAQQLSLSTVIPEPNEDQDRHVEQIIAYLEEGRHVRIHGPQGTCRTTLLSKVHTRLTQDDQHRSAPIFLLGSRAMIIADATDATEPTLHRAIAAVLVQARKEHVYWSEVHEQLHAILKQLEPRESPIYLLIDDCDDQNLVEHLFCTNSTSLRCVLVVPNDNTHDHPLAVSISTSNLKRMYSNIMDYDWYCKHIEKDSLRQKKLGLLHILLETGCPLMYQEIQDILVKYGPEELIDCVTSLSSQHMHYAVHNTGSILSTPIDPKSWHQHANHSIVASSLHGQLQVWCDENWKIFEKKGKLPESMLRILSSQRLRQVLQPVPNEPVTEGAISDAYKPWLALILQARAYHSDLAKHVTDLIKWRSREGPYVEKYTALDHWMLDGIIMAMCDPNAAAERDEDTMPIDDSSVERVLNGKKGNQSDVQQELRRAMQKFWQEVRDAFSKTTQAG